MALATDHKKLLPRVIDRVDLEALGRDLVEVFVDSIPGYAELPKEVLAGQVLQTSTTALELFKGIVDDPTLPSEADLVDFRSSAQNRAAEGLPLGDVLRAYRLGGQRAWAAVVAASESDEERDALLVMAELVMAYIDRLSSAVAEAYLATSQHIISEDTRLVAELIDALCGDEEISSELRRFADRIGAQVADSYRPFALSVLDSPAHVHSQIAAALRLEGVLALTEGDAVVGIAGPDVSAESFSAGKAILVLREPVSRAELSRALPETRTLLAVARRRNPAPGLVDESELAVSLLLARSPRVAEKIRDQVLGPLESYEDSRGGDLLETVEVYFAHELNRRKAADTLHVHPNTLDYRLGRVEELCGVKLTRPADIAMVELALAQRGLS